MKRIIVASSLALIIGLITGCSSEKTVKTDKPKTASVQKEKELTAKDIFKKATDEFQKEEHIVMTQDFTMNLKSQGISMDMKAKTQLEPKKGNSRAEMNVLGKDIVFYCVDGKIAGKVKDPNSGRFIQVPADQFKVDTDKLKVYKRTVEDFERILKIADKIKVEKVGDKYKLTFQFEGKEATEMLKNINENAGEAFDEKQITMSLLSEEFIITKGFKFESMKMEAKMNTDKEESQITGDAKFSYDEEFDPIRLPGEQNGSFRKVTGNN